MERLAEADHRRAGDGDVVEADDALVQPGRVDEVGRGHQRGRVVERRQGRLARQRAVLGERGPEVERRLRGHGRDCTGGGGPGAGRTEGPAGAGERRHPIDSPPMCGRFTQQRRRRRSPRIFEAEDLFDDPGGRFNVAPTDEAAVVVQRDDQRAVVGYRWGLIPGWADDPRIASRSFNARAESVATSPLFRDAFRRRRCLVPVDGFYEWLRDGKTASRCASTIRTAGRSPSPGCGPAARTPSPAIWHRTFTIVTTRPNAFMAPIHDRMPVVVPPDAWATWLDPTRRDPGELRALLEPRDDVGLDAYPVPPLVNNVRNNGPELIERLDPSGASQLPLP